jgi:predicted metalloprotease with PDZ domain
MSRYKKPFAVVLRRCLPHNRLRRYTLLPLLTAPLSAIAAPPLPQPSPQPPPIVAPQDRPFPGTVELSVDATDLDRHIFRVVETIPVPAGDKLTLLFPNWLPGNHGPTGPLPSLAGLMMTAQGRPVTWLRDTVDISAFHVDVPADTKALRVEFQYLSPVDSKDGRVVTTANMLDVQWRPEILFPAGYFQRDIQVHPSVTLPAGWHYATALDTAHADGGQVDFKPVALDTLLDSPLYAGRYFSRVDLDPGGPVPVHLNVVADRPEDLAIKPDDLQAHRNLVQQAYRNFGSHHYDHYDFLFSVSREMGGIGLEHQRSTEVGGDQFYFTDPNKSAPERDLLPHEYTHSWNGKFRRPADLWSPDDHVVPERDSLLWVYEGQTEYWGQVLAARSGIMKQAQLHDLLAYEAAALDAGTPGRIWRNLQDTTNDPIISWHHPSQWSSWSRFGDYYPEGLLIWLDADTLIREKSNGAKSLTDFARLFFGVDNGVWTTETYTFDNVVRTLNQVQPNDWATFLRDRLDGHGPGAPLDGLTRSGWKLSYTAEKSALEKTLDGLRHGDDFTYSLGLTVNGEGAITDVLWNGPAFKAGIARGTKLVAVNGLALDGSSTLSDAITRAASDKAPITLLLQDGSRYRDVQIDYHDGLRYPHLERISGTPDRLADILAPLK